MRYSTTPQDVGFRSSTQPTAECFFRQNLRSIAMSLDDFILKVTVAEVRSPLKASVKLFDFWWGRSLSLLIKF
ncbi:hypothetical protein [Nostoc sp.]|uniref:hypothetical protein n=1 Tax=Nostoc sp. TaxID=1180 RepID=UPI002FFC39C2